MSGAGAVTLARLRVPGQNDSVCSAYRFTAAGGLKCIVQVGGNARTMAVVIDDGEALAHIVAQRNCRGTPMIRCCDAMGMTGLFAVALGVHAQPHYPARPVRIVVPYFAGTPSDLSARMLGQKFNEAWGKPVVIENVAGASGNIGTERVARANPDGHSLVLPGNAPLAINPSLYPNLPFDPLKDFAPISQVTLSASMLAVQNTLGVKNVQELVALAITQPGKLTYGTGGSGTPQHMAGELFNTMAGIRIVHIPYKGPPPSLLDLIGGRLTAVFGISSVVLPLARTDKIRTLAVTSLQRTGAAPDVPTMAESGFPGFEATSWFALLAPAGTPQTIVRKIHGETVKALAQPDIRARLTDLGMDVVGSTPEQLAAIMRAEIPKWAKVVKASGAKLE